MGFKIVRLSRSIFESNFTKETICGGITKVLAIPIRNLKMKKVYSVATTSFTTLHYGFDQLWGLLIEYMLELNAKRHSANARTSSAKFFKDTVKSYFC